MAESYKEIFEIEMHCWCLGLYRNKDTLDVKVLNRVIKEFAPIIKEAIENLYPFDILDITNRFLAASKCKASQQEVAFYILSMLPNPSQFSNDQRNVLIKIVENLEKKYSGAFERLEKKWKISLSGFYQGQGGVSLFDSLSVPKIV